MTEIVKLKTTDLVDPQAQRIVEFLGQMGLPSDNIIAPQSERTRIGDNLPAVLDALSPDLKRDARYLSKFVVGAGVGLFDYSLNAIWNEVVLNLRRKAIMYGLDIFYDAAVGGGKNRDLYEDENDLPSLKDSVLLDTSRKLELISDITYKKLKHVLDMRNDIGISHPTNYAINAFELLGWLETCVSGVLEDKPTEAAIQVQAFIKNLKTSTDPIDGHTKSTVEQKLSQLPQYMCGNLLRTVFGIFVSDGTDLAVRKNISVIAPTIWANCDDDSKYKLGMVLEGYKSNLHKDKYKLGEQFFELVNGNAFRSESERALIVDSILTELKDKHDGWDNFSHEASVARVLSSYVGEQTDILDNFAPKLFRTVLDCRIGRGLSYCQGVSPRGKDYYDAILRLAGDKYIPHVMAALSNYDFQAQLGSSIARTQCRQALEEARKNVVNERLLEGIDYLIKNIEADQKSAMSGEFKKITANYIKWP
jgi:hypothetical protein